MRVEEEEEEVGVEEQEEEEEEEGEETIGRVKEGLLLVILVHLVEPVLPLQFSSSGDTVIPDDL